MLALTLIMIIASLCECQAVMQQQKFKTWKGYKLYNGTQIRDTSLKTMSPARCASLCTGDCKSATFSRTLNRCVTFRDRVYDSSIKRTSDPQWCILYKNEPVQFGQWTLVFRGQRDTNQSLYDLWTSTGTSDDNPLSIDFPVECLHLTYSDTCKRHFRSFILDQWVNIDMVKLSIYNDGVEMKYILFDGSDTTLSSWFEQSRILSSSWMNIMSDSNIADFSIDGLDDGVSVHRFSIHSSYETCLQEATFFFVMDIFKEFCSPEWSMIITSFPKFIYSPGDKMAPMHSSPTGKSGAN